MFIVYFFFFNDTATTEIYTLSLHDALPIFVDGEQSRLARVDQHGDHELVVEAGGPVDDVDVPVGDRVERARDDGTRSEEHTSELQSRQYLVCRLLLEKKKKQTNTVIAT